MQSANRSTSAERPRVLFLNRSYWPDAEATGQLLSELCEDLSANFDMTVIAGQPNQNPHGVKFRKTGTETHAGVTIRRVMHTRFPKGWLPGRALNLVSYLLMALWAGMWSRRPAIIVTETDPFLLPLLGGFLRVWHRCRLVVYLQDIYPDVAICLGKIKQSWFTRLLRNRLFSVYRKADRVVVLSDDMRTVLVSSGVPVERISCIPNWADTRLIYPVKTDNPFRIRELLEDKFVVMYSGNLGLSQQLEEVLGAAIQIRERRDILFLFVGDGASKRRLQELAQQNNLQNVRFLPYQPKEELAQSLSAADLHLISVDPRISHCLMPSKLYGILASATPVLTIANLSSELCRIVKDCEVGLTANPHDAAEVAQAIVWCAEHPAEMTAMGRRSRALAEQRYDRKHCTSAYSAMLSETLLKQRGIIGRRPELDVNRARQPVV